MVRIFTEEGGKEGEKIVGVEDRWNGRIPEGWVATVSFVSFPSFFFLPLSFLFCFLFPVLEGRGFGGRQASS